MTSGSGRPTATPAAAESPGRVAVGRVAAAHGIRGELAVDPLSDVPGRFAVGERLLLSRAGATTAVTVTAARPHKGRLLVRLEGVDDRTAAEALRGALLEVEESAVPPAPADTYYHFELVGCRCIDRHAGELGEVVEVLEGGGGELLRVDGPRGELLLPFVDSYLAAVDVASRRIDWDLPEGFLEACGSAS